MDPILIASDLHLTDKPVDEYRFDIFQFMIKRVSEHGIKTVFVLGDLTEKKDRHSARLVNRIVDLLAELSSMVPVCILMGNHDAVDKNSPFFAFLNKLHNIRFFIKTTMFNLPGGRVLMVPHQNGEAWPDFSRLSQRPDYVMLHQTVEGAIAESGGVMAGFPIGPIKALQAKAIISGDIHRPQNVGPVTYVGSPYAIRFGDDFSPRIILIRDGKLTSIATDYPRKHTLEADSVDNVFGKRKLRKGDHVKIRLVLGREQLTDWASMKQSIMNRCTKLGLQVFGFELVKRIDDRSERSNRDDKGKKLAGHRDIFDEFCKREKLSALVIEAGISILG